MEQRAVMRFFTLKDLSPKDIHTELESVYMDDGWGPLFTHSLQMTRAFHARENRAIWWSAVRMVFAEWSRRRPSCHDSEIPFYFMQTSLYSFQTRITYLLVHLTRYSPFEKSSIYNMSRTLSTTLERLNGCHFPRTF
jgi:hypothetical protein